MIFSCAQIINDDISFFHLLLIRKFFSIYKFFSAENQKDNLMTVVVPDITPHAFTTLINFLYSDLNIDTVKLDDDGVMETLYAGNSHFDDLILSFL